MIKDSGERREFETGAVRDITEGKGRFDLIPLDILAEYQKDKFIYYISMFQRTGEELHLINAVKEFSERAFGSFETAVMEVAIHYEQGAKKYGENNWQKGIPQNSYIDSALRHYYKWKRGDDDERHDRAVIWNLLCLHYEARWGNRHCDTCRFYVRDKESALYQKCLADDKDTTVYDKHRCKKWEYYPK